MGIYQTAFDEAIAALPRLGAAQLARDKLADVGIENDEIADRLACAILAGKDGRIDIDWPESVVITFNDADLERLQGAINRLIERFPDMVDEMTANAAGKLVDGLRKQWAASRPIEDPMARIRSHVLKDWAEPINALRMLVSLCTEEGDEYNIAHLKSKHRRMRTEALARLHIRACRIANEILLLLDHGHTEGAQARWRTLHEVAITATLIADGGDTLAQRFFDHDAVERKRALDDHRRAAEAASEPTLPIAQANEIDRDFERVVAKYDRHFQGTYGWASGQLGMPKEPKFYNLQETAGSLSLKLRFRIASAGNHASVMTLGQPVHRWDPMTCIPGAFTAGLEGPGADTAQAIVHVTIALFEEPWDLDRIILVRTLAQLRTEVGDLWHRTARHIEKREQRSIDRALRFRPGRRVGYVKAKPGKRRV